MRHLQGTPANIYSSPNAHTDRLFATRKAIIRSQMAMIDGSRAWVAYAPLPDDHEQFKPDAVYGRNGVFRNWELGEVPYSAGYVFTPVGGGL